MYAMEGLDQPSGTTVFDWVLDVAAARDAFRQEWKPDMLGGIVTLRHGASRPSAAARTEPLYQALIPRQFTAGEVTLIPYYAFHNREITSMQVWIPYRETR